jgi:DNA-binding response OmpR family regulator
MNENAPAGRLLFVDDEELILHSLQREFSNSGYDVLTAPGAAQGLRLLESETVDVLVAD